MYNLCVQEYCDVHCNRYNPKYKVIRIMLRNNPCGSGKKMQISFEGAEGVMKIM